MIATFKKSFFIMIVAMAVQGMESEEETLFCGENYQENLAREKIKSMWDNILKTAFNDKLPRLEGPGFSGLIDLMSTTFLAQAFTNKGDVMAEGRPKHIHRQGTTIRIRFIAKNSRYSGFFSAGAPYAILRLSLADRPNEKFIPGLAIKFFRNGLPSVNIMAMPSLDGQTDANLFTRAYTNVVPQPPFSLTGYALECKFASTIAALKQRNPNPRALPLKHLAETDINGSIIFDTTTPYEIIFEPTNAAQSLMENAKANDDFRAILDGKGKNIILFDVYARDGETPGEKIYLGQIETLTNFCASSFGDQLYFQHPLDAIEAAD